MADIRINALATTAASTASDDFVAVDGSANGTRKLNAYSPTFGGNLTLSGTTSTITLGSTNTGSIAVDANGALIVTPKAGQYTTLSVSGNSGLFVNNGTTQIYLGNSGGNAVAGTLNANDFLLIRDGAVKLTATATGVDISGNLTVSGTGTSSVAGKLGIGTTSPLGVLDVRSTTPDVLFNGKDTADPVLYFGRYQYDNVSKSGAAIKYVHGSAGGSQEYGRLTFLTATGSFGALTERMRINESGNVLIGTNIDAGGKLQIATGASNTLLIGNDATYTSYNQISLNGTRTNSGVLGIIGGASGDSQLYLLAPTGGGLLFQIAASTVFSVNSSGNATFAGAIAINNTVQTAVAVASTHKVTISIGGTTYYLLATNV